MSTIVKTEKWIKELMFDCKMCGQCILSHTALVCPMNCPKGLRNGPCGGTLDGKCEVLPELDCVWMTIQTKKKRHPHTVHLPPDPALFDTASYVNFFNGKDRQTRLPKEPTNTLHILASSKLSEKMHAQQFVVTLEIASPRTSAGLKNVEKIMARTARHVDAVNTTTNAGGRASLHSTETGKVVMAHGVESIIQFCGRDHDKDDFLRQMDAAIGEGYRNFLLLTGDWLPQTERKVAKETWFPMDSSQMIFFVNEALADFRDRLGVVPFIGAAANPFSTPTEVTVERLAKKRHAGARFCQTQAVTDSGIFRDWYALVRKGREDEAKLTIPSIPLVGSLRGFEILQTLPGVHVSDAMRQRAESAGDDLPRVMTDWALDIAHAVVGVGAAGVHAMNFGMPPEYIDEFLIKVRACAGEVRAAAGIEG
ncbi:MAG: methylenetetrahydrofolate reductase C-terminal domain-containing protein [Chthoniobacterales bacterium]